MSDDTLDWIRAVNPIPVEPPPVPIDEFLRRLQADDPHDLRCDDPAPRGRRLIVARRPSVGGVMIAISALTTAAVTVFAIAVLGHSQSSTIPNGGRPSATAPLMRPHHRAVDGYPRAWRPLLETLAVLRRPQTNADLDPGLLAQLNEDERHPRVKAELGNPVISLIRFATVTPWGQKIFFVPSTPLTPRQIAGLPAKDRVGARAWTRAFPGLRLMRPGGLAPVAQIKAGRDTVTTQSNQLVLVVPDGVAKVKLLPIASATQRHPVPVTATVRHNIAAFQAQEALEPKYEIWYAASGKIIKRMNVNSCHPALSGCD